MPESDLLDDLITPTILTIKNIKKNIAKILGMSQTGYSKYETGENDIPTLILIKLSRFYDVSIDYILGETDDAKKK